MPRLAKRRPKHIDIAFDRRAAWRARGTLNVLADSEAAKVDAFEQRYGQQGKASSYAAEMAELAKIGPEAKQGVVYQSWRRRKKVYFDPADENTLIHRKKRLNGKTLKFVRQVALGEANQTAGGAPKAFVARLIKTRGRKIIDSEYDSDGKLKRKLKQRSGGRFKEQWETDTKGRLIRTDFKTNRLRDGIIFSPVSERMSELDANGKRQFVQRRGRREWRFERDEETGTLTFTGRKGVFRSQNISFKSDGSLAHNRRGFGNIWKENVEFIGADTKRVTRKIFGLKSVRTVQLTGDEKEQQVLLRQARARSSHGSISSGKINSAVGSDASPPIYDEALMSNRGDQAPPREKTHRLGADQSRLSGASMNSNTKALKALVESVENEQQHASSLPPGFSDLRQANTNASGRSPSDSATSGRGKIYRLGPNQPRSSGASTDSNTAALNALMDSVENKQPAKPASSLPPASSDLRQVTATKASGSRFAGRVEFSPATPPVERRSAAIGR